jgi:hypothetical protein
MSYAVMDNDEKNEGRQQRQNRGSFLCHGLRPVPAHGEIGVMFWRGVPNLCGRVKEIAPQLFCVRARCASSGRKREMDTI